MPAGTLTPTEHRRLILRRFNALWTERSSWDAHWREIAAYSFPRASRFLQSDVNRGTKKHNLIHDNTAIFALRTLAAGMMSGMTSPARPWFRLALRDRDLMEYGPVKAWLHAVAEKMRAVFSASNTYNALHQCYEELGAFGTWANFVRPNFQTVIHHYPMTVGEYALAVDDMGRVDTLARKLHMTVGQLAKQFPRESLSTAVRNLIDRNSLDAWVPVMHFIAPRSDLDPTKRDARNMRFESVYLEAGSNEDRFLGVGGFERFPALCPRWVVTSNDTYGRSPGMDCLGDVKQLQHQQLRKAQGIDYQVMPPIQVPTAYKDQADKRLPGGVMYVDSATPGGGVRSAFDVQINLQHLTLDIQDTRERIRSAYYADLFLMLANMDRTSMTAAEVAERHEEKLLMLGPVLERLQNELHAPLIDITFDQLAAAGALPPAPEELQGVELEVEFVSTLAQAQRAVAAAGTDRWLATIGQLAPIFPGVVAKVNADQIVDEYGEMYGVNPRLIVPDEEAAAAREAQARALQAQQAAAAAPVAADAAKTVSEINPEGMRDVLGMFQGYNTPTPGVA